jgi:hypothetical protein
MKDLKVAYLILAHADPLQMERLVNALNYKCDFYIHIDKFSDIENFKVLNLPPNTFFIEQRVPVNWAGFSQVIASSNLIKAAIASGENYSHLVLLSGMDYPIKPPEQIVEYLFDHSDKQFIRFTYMEDAPDAYMWMMNHYFFRDDLPFIQHRQARRVFRYLMETAAKPFKRKYFENIKPCAGSSWWAITLDCAKYIIDYMEANPKFVEYHHHTFASDEHFYHTVVANSKFAHQVAFQERTKLSGPYNFANLHIVHPSLTKIYTLEDLQEIKDSKMFFVRKVTSEKSTALLNEIDQQILSKSKHLKIE